ncbi:MAG: hypothetical protein M3530_05430 [Thermoproteota archaeon]|nr:hypothetical protein [Thermoproteota archaeon]
MGIEKTSPTTTRVQHLADSGSTPSVASYQTAFPSDLLGFMAMTSFYDRTAEKRAVDSDVPLDQIAPKARILAFNAIKPIYEATKLALQKQATFFQNWWDLYVPLPKVLVSDFSCYLCPRCLAKEAPVPIKDRGVDLTCEGRHRCRAASRELNNLTLDQKSRSGDNMFNDLYRNIDLWIPGKKLIVANMIAVPHGKDDDTIRKYIQKQYGIPNKYHLEDVHDFQRSPWILRLLRYGKIEPTHQQLDDFCSYCVGTYAILRIRVLDSVKYYTAYLASAESIENPNSDRPNDPTNPSRPLPAVEKSNSSVEGRSLFFTK